MSLSATGACSGGTCASGGCAEMASTEDAHGMIAVDKLGGSIFVRQE